MKNLARKATLTILGALILAPGASASFRLDIAGPHGRFSIGTDDYIEYGEAGAYSDYHAALEGYGRWIYQPEWGEVFVPSVDVSWRPYLYGRWNYTNFGLTWVSYEPWGYLPHHYGRWYYMSGTGWCWRPGYRYYAANVGFYYGGDYVGWWPSGCCGGGGGIHLDIDVNIFINIVHRSDFMGTGLYGRLVAASRVPLLRANRLPRAMPVPTRAAMERFIGRPITSVKMQQRKLLVAGHAMTMPVPGKQLRSEVIKSARKVAASAGPKRIGMTHRGQSPRRTVAKKTSPSERHASPRRGNKLDRRTPRSHSRKVAPRGKATPSRRGNKLDRRSLRTHSRKVAPRGKTTPSRRGNKLDRRTPRTHSRKVAPRGKTTSPRRGNKLDRRSPRTRSRKVAPRGKTTSPRRSNKLDRRSPRTRSRKVTPRGKTTSPRRGNKLDRRSPRTHSRKVAPSPHRVGPSKHPRSRPKKASPKKRSRPQKHKKSPSKKHLLA